jgi:Flp pilus assembly protein TadG
MTWRRFKNYLQSEKGSNAVEFALLLPVLVMLIFGIFEFGRVYNNYLAITHAAREGVRIAAVGLNNPELKSIIIERAYPVSLTAGDIAISTPQGTEIGDPVEVQITYTVSINIPLVRSWNIPLTTRATMRLEHYQ